MQLSDEIIKVLEYLCTKIGITIDWTSNNVLPYVQQLCEKYVKWEISTSTAWIAIMIVAVIITFIFSKVTDLDGFEDLVFWIMVVVALIVIGVQVFDIIECWAFPEKAIYGYVQSLLSNK